MLRRKTDPKTGKNTLCELTQSKCTWTMSQDAVCTEIYRENAGGLRYNAGRFRYHLDWTPLNCYRKNSSVSPFFLRGNSWNNFVSGSWGSWEFTQQKMIKTFQFWQSKGAKFNLWNTQRIWATPMDWLFWNRFSVAIWGYHSLQSRQLRSQHNHWTIASSTSTWWRNITNL